LQGLTFLVRSIGVAWIDNQWSSGVVTARVRRSIRGLHHQRRDLHQSTYLYLSEDRHSTPHQDQTAMASPTTNDMCSMEQLHSDPDDSAGSCGVSIGPYYNKMAAT
jgi:hypothetical protein